MGRWTSFRQLSRSAKPREELEGKIIRFDESSIYPSASSPLSESEDAGPTSRIATAAVLDPFNRHARKTCFSPASGIGHFPRRKMVRLQVERIPHNHLRGFNAHELADFSKTIAGLHFLGQDERLLMGHALDQTKGRGHDVHLPVADENVAVAAKALHALVLVFVVMVDVEKIAMTYHEIEHGIDVPVGILRIAAKDVVDRASVVQAPWEPDYCCRNWRRGRGRPAP